MTPEDAAMLLTLRRARERRAAAELARASAEMAQAAAELDRAERLARAFAAMRRSQAEVAVRDLAAGGPAMPGLVTDTAAKLLDLGARAQTYEELRQRRAASLAERERLRNRAREAHQATLRRAEAWEAMGEQLEDIRAGAAEQAAEDALEEAAAIAAARARSPWTR